jgi:hypothetical protein
MEQVKQVYKRLARDAVPLVGAVILLMATGTSVYAQARLNCSPTVDLETQSCGAPDKFQTFARVTNKCSCDVSVSIQLPGGGSASFTAVKRDGGSQREMIRACDSKQRAIGQYTYDFSCPERSTNLTPRDLSSQLKSASADAKDAGAKNQQDVSQLNRQHQQAVANNVAQYKAGLRNWCASHAQNCDAQCISKNPGSQNYMSACVNLCSTIVDACVSKTLDDESQRAQAEARVRAADANMKRVVDQLNRELGEQRAREEMENALQVHEFLNALSGMGGNTSTRSPPPNLISYRAAPAPAPPPVQSSPSYNPPSQTQTYMAPSTPAKTCYTSKTELKYGYGQICD